MLINHKALKTATLIATLLVNFSPLQTQAMERMFSYSGIATYCLYIRKNDVSRSETIARLNDLYIESGVSKKDFLNKYFYNIDCNSQSAISYSADNDLGDVIALSEFGIDLSKPYKTHDGKTLTLKDYVLYKFKNTDGGDRTKFRRIYKFLHKNGYKNCADQPELNCTATKYLLKHKTGSK